MDTAILVYGKTGLKSLIWRRLDDDLCRGKATERKKPSRDKNSFKFDRHNLLFIEWIKILF